MKKIMQRIGSFFCAVLVSFGTLISSSPVVLAASGAAAAAGTILAVIGVIESIKSFCETVQWVWDIVEPIVNEVKIHVDTSSEIVALCDYYKSYWNEIIVRGEMTESQFREYWEFVVLNGEDSTKELEYPGISDTYVMVIETVASGVSLDELCSLFFNADGTAKRVSSVNEKNQIEIPAEWLKEHAQDYNNRYKPMPNEEQYIISWQNSKSEKTGTDLKWFPENAPVYTYTSGTWGDRRWNEVYILPFFYNDDDSRGYFYGQNFLHFYSSKEDDNTVMIHSDVYSFVDNLKDDNRCQSVAWDVTNYPYLGFQLSGSNFALYSYKSSSGLFLGSLATGTSKCTRLSYFNSYMIFTLTPQTSNLDLSSLISYASPNFTPATNTSDDWGYIVSNKPFVNMLNQTAIDFDKIPDNYVITISGDTIYNYPITNPDTGDSTNITNYVTNNYTIPEKEPSGGGDSGGSSGMVSGKIDVSGKIEIVSSGGGTGAEFDQDLSLNNYYDWMQEQSTGFTGFMKEYLSWLPEDIVIMLCAGLALVILARFLGR